MKRILIMGLPGAGKTTFAKELKKQLESIGYTVAWYNADDVRKTFNDWDFSLEGRLRQSDRMRELANLCETDFVICDFIAPLKQMRTKFDAHFVIWLDTIVSSDYADTNQLFDQPTSYNIRIKERDTLKYLADVLEQLLN